MKLKKCIGFGEFEGKCNNKPDSPSGYWCKECEQLRRKTITKQMENIRDSFNKVSSTNK